MNPEHKYRSPKRLKSMVDFSEEERNKSNEDIYKLIHKNKLEDKEIENFIIETGFWWNTEDLYMGMKIIVPNEIDSIEKIPLDPQYYRGLNISPKEVYKGKSDYMLIYDNEKQILNLIK